MPIHPTAIVDKKAEIDPTAEIGPFCVIDAHVHIGPGCRLMHNVFVTGWTRIEENGVVHAGAIVGHEPQDAKYKGERTFCRIGRNVTLREYVTIHRGTDPESETVVGDDCLLLAGAHVAHNCTLGRGVTLINNALLAGHVSVHDRTVISGSTVVHQFVRIGTLAMIPGNGRVIMDVVPYALLDVEGRVAGINRIGLRRAGFSREAISAVRDVYRAYFNRHGTYDERRAALANLPPSEALTHFQEFLSVDSRRGIAGRSKRSAAPAAEDAR